jgi:O-antigen/teichoic acid export membrane protein
VITNAVALGGSNLWRIVVNFFLQLLIARQLGLEALGAYTIIMAYLNVSQVVSELGLPGLMVRDLAQRPTHRLGYFRIALGLQITASFLSWAVLVLVAWVLPLPEVTKVALMLVGASLPLAAITSVTQTLFQASERMELVLSVEGVVNTLIVVTTALVLWMGIGLVGLMALLVATQTVSAALGLILIWRTGLIGGPQQPVALHLPELGRRVAPFFGLAVAEVLLQRVDILMLSLVAGERITALYSVAYQLVRVLLKLIQSGWRALYPTLSRLHHESLARYRRLANTGLRIGLLILVPGVLIAMLIASWVLGLLFGLSAVAAAPVLRLLIWTAPLYLVESYASILLMVERRPAQSLLISSLHVAAVILLLPPLTALWQATGTATAMLLVGLLSALVGLWMVRSIWPPPSYRIE